VQTLTRIVCDFCCRDTTEAWYFTHRSFLVGVSSLLLDAHAGEAAACAECRPLVDRKDEPALLQRFAAGNPGASRSSIEFAGIFQHLLIPCLTGAVRYVKLGDLEPTPDRFFEDACPRCKAVHVYDRDEARDQKIERTCSCGLKLFVGPIGFRREPRKEERV